MLAEELQEWVCVGDPVVLVPNSGVCALVGGRQVAIFYLPGSERELYAVGNWDPVGKANVLSRGILGDIKGKLVIASPLYKHHFDLTTGQCLEEPSVFVPVYQVKIESNQLWISVCE